MPITPDTRIVKVVKWPGTDSEPVLRVMCDVYNPPFNWNKMLERGLAAFVEGFPWHEKRYSARLS